MSAQACAIFNTMTFRRFQNKICGNFIVEALEINIKIIFAKVQSSSKLLVPIILSFMELYGD